MYKNILITLCIIAMLLCIAIYKLIILIKKLKGDVIYLDDNGVEIK